jgi:plasmid maintenance system antidote protein VapI
MRLNDDFRPDWLSPPGDTVAELMDDAGMPRAEFVRRLGVSERMVADLLLGRHEITKELAVCLSDSLGFSASFWMVREAEYRESLREFERQWKKALPVRDMCNWGWIDGGTADEAFQQCLEFFGVSDLLQWRRDVYPLLNRARFRDSQAFDSNLHSVLAWLRRGELSAQALTVAAWDGEAFRKELPKLRKLSRKLPEPRNFLPVLQQRCGQYGVRVVIERAPKGCRASGSARFLDDGSALLMLSGRYLSDDHLWFSFFHEAGHLVLHGSQGVFLDSSSDWGKQDPLESEADEFAASMLIPERCRGQLDTMVPTVANVERLAARAGVSPGIVVGQLQHRRRLGWDKLQFLKRRYAWR